MEALSHPAFIDLARESRETWNQEFVRARHQYSRLEPEAVQAMVIEFLQPAMGLILPISEGGARTVIRGWFVQSLQLLGKGLVGATRENRIFPALLQLLEANPKIVLFQPSAWMTGFVNALWQIQETSGARLSDWVGLMTRFLPRCSTLPMAWDRGTGAAWVCGMAHLREKALSILETFGSGDGKELFSLSGNLDDSSWKTLVSALREDPWLEPGKSPGKGTDSPIRIRQAVGGFRGLGGVFQAPPRLVGDDQRLLAVDGGTIWWVHGDAFGSTTHRVSLEPLPVGTPLPEGWSMSPAGVVKSPRGTAHLPELAGFSQGAGFQNGLAVTLPHSHKVFLVA